MIAMSITLISILKHTGTHDQCMMINTMHTHMYTQMILQQRLN